MKDKLNSWLENETDERVSSLIKELISVYSDLDRERAKNAKMVDILSKRNQAIKELTKISNDHSEERDRMIEAIIELNKTQIETTESFKQMYWLANYSKTPLFSSKLLMRLWVEISDLFKSTSQIEAEEIQSKILITLGELDADDLLVDARDSVLFYDKFSSKDEKIPEISDDPELEEINA